MIALLDYGAGNLTSVRKALTAVGAAHFTPDVPRALESAAGIIIPGVGHFGATRAILDEWRRAILVRIDRGAPLLGICLGMQYLFEGSDEAPDAAGLGLLPGRCIALPSTVKVPHVGWNSLVVSRTSRLLSGLPDGSQVYFTHSFAAPITEASVAVSEHGVPFAAAVERGRVFGVQFHPEKSSTPGLRVLDSFLAITRSTDRQAARCCPSD